MTVKMRKRGLLAIGGIALVAGAASIGYAAIPADDGTIAACYGNGSRLIRVIDTDAGETCRPNETPLTWNIEGQQGPPGPQGEPGPEGPPGPAGGDGVSPPANLIATSPGETKTLLPIDGLGRLEATCGPNGRVSAAVLRATPNDRRGAPAGRAAPETATHALSRRARLAWRGTADSTRRSA